MKLETTPVDDNYGITQIEAQLEAMALQLCDMKKGKTGREEVCVHNVAQKVMPRNIVLW